MRPRLPFLSGASRTESLLAGNLFPAEHQRRADPQLGAQEAKASLLTRPDRFPQTPARPMAPFTLAGGETPRFQEPRLQVGDTGAPRRQKGTTAAGARPASPPRDPARGAARPPTAPRVPTVPGPPAPAPGSCNLRAGSCGRRPAPASRPPRPRLARPKDAGARAGPRSDRHIPRGPSAPWPGRQPAPAI